jgi:Mycoplasma protein of unknown function, DUF285
LKSGRYRTLIRSTQDQLTFNQTRVCVPVTTSHLCCLFFFFGINKPILYISQDFVSIWKTDNPGVSQSDQIRIPGTGTSYTIVWEEVSNLSNNGSEIATNEFTVTFPSPGIYRIRISGNFTRIRFNNSGDKRKIMDVESWGNIEWISMDEAFYGCSNLQVSASDAPNLSNVTSLRKMFMLAVGFNSPINHWDVSTIQSLESTFSNTFFNQPLYNWNVSNVTTLVKTFDTSLSFNQDISSWDVSNVESFGATFFEAWAFINLLIAGMSQKE